MKSQQVIFSLLFSLVFSSLSTNTYGWTMSEMGAEITSLKTQIRTLKGEVSDLSPVPKDFIYVQLPWQKQPNEVWVGTAWEEVTTSYAGYFFRALGGDSASFGSTQTGNAPRLISVRAQDRPNGGEHVIRTATIKEHGVSDGWLWAGNNPLNSYTHDQVGMDFETSGGEVRPKNLAVKIWKRI